MKLKFYVIWSSILILSVAIAFAIPPSVSLWQLNTDGSISPKNDANVVIDNPLQNNINIISSAGNITISESQMESIILMTAAGEALIPDVCDSATGEWIIIKNKTATNQVEVAVADTSNDKFVLIDGTALDVNDEVDLSTDASSEGKFVCMETNTWYVTKAIGPITDGGVAD